jgi:ketosteroid isomerase-like protein
MSENFATPQDAEDAFYDAIDDRDAERLRAVWEDSDDIACLLPMQPMLHGADVHEAFRPLTDGEVQLDIQVRHLRWLETGNLAIHFMEERVSVPGNPPQAPVYAVNIYRRGDSGWRLLVHQNSPTPPPPGSMMPPGMPPGQTPS